MKSIIPLIKMQCNAKSNNYSDCRLQEWGFTHIQSVLHKISTTIWECRKVFKWKGNKINITLGNFMSLPSGYFENTTALNISLNAASNSVLKQHSIVSVWVNKWTLQPQNIIVGLTHYHCWNSTDSISNVGSLNVPIGTWTEMHNE